MAVVRQAAAAAHIGVTRPTLIAWERKGLLRRVATPRPGAWYDTGDLDRFILSLDSHPAQAPTPEEQ